MCMKRERKRWTDIEINDLVTISRRNNREKTRFRLRENSSLNRLTIYRAELFNLETFFLLLSPFSFYTTRAELNVNRLYSLRPSSPNRILIVASKDSILLNLEFLIIIIMIIRGKVRMGQRRISSGWVGERYSRYERPQIDTADPPWNDVANGTEQGRLNEASKRIRPGKLNSPGWIEVVEHTKAGS